MFIKITRNIIDAAIAGDKRALDLLRDMDFSCHHGKHLFMGDHETLVLIQKHFSSNFPTLAKLFTQISTLGAIANVMNWHVEFGLEEGESVVKEDNGKYTIVISKNDFSLFKTFNECHILVENLEDVQMYQYILDFYKRNNNLVHTYNNYYSILGGGSTTAMVLKHEMELRHSLILCIVDSDKIHPRAQIKETAKKVKEEYLSSPFKYNTLLYILEDVMEVENLVPISIYEKYCTPQDGEGTKKELYRHFQVIQSIWKQSEEYLDYFDFKVGIQPSHLVDDSCDNTNRKIIESIAPLLNFPIVPNSEHYKRVMEILSMPELALSPQTKEKYANKCMNSDTYVFGLGKDVLKKVLDSCAESFRIISNDQLSKTQNKVYAEIGRLMYCWTCASEPHRL